MADWDICCDDSHKNGSRYIVYAGVMLARDLAAELSDRIGAWRDRECLTDEIKWVKTTPANLERFKVFASGAMRYIDCGKIQFAAAVFDRQERNLFRGDSHEEQWGNLAFDFLLNCFALKAGGYDRMWIYPDHEMLRCNSVELCDRLNAAIAFRKSWLGVDIVRSIRPRQSESCHFVQMVDLFAGAIGASNNMAHNLTSKRGQAKQHLLEHIRALSTCDLKHGTCCRHPFFNLWSYVPRIKKAAPVS